MSNSFSKLPPTVYFDPVITSTLTLLVYFLKDLCRQSSPDGPILFLVHQEMTAVIFNQLIKNHNASSKVAVISKVEWTPGLLTNRFTIDKLKSNPIVFISLGFDLRSTAAANEAIKLKIPTVQYMPIKDFFKVSGFVRNKNDDAWNFYLLSLILKFYLI